MLECRDNGAINGSSETAPVQELQPSMFFYENPECDAPGWLHYPRFHLLSPLNTVQCNFDSFHLCRDILDHQFLDEPESDPVYGTRSIFGYPQIATLTAGGDDVEFLWLIMYCILQFFKNNPCQEQITRSQEIIDGDLLYNSLDYVIKNALIRGITAAGPGFKLFVTGYAQFFNGTSTQCDKTCFSYWDPGCENSMKLDQSLRQQLNTLALNLNQKIQDVVQNNAQWDVEYVSYDDQFEGHRFCEGANTEPDDNNPNSELSFPTRCFPFHHLLEAGDLSRLFETCVLTLKPS